MKTFFRLLLLCFLQFALASCADKKESAESCSVKLDEQNYSKVSENENCTNYERASAYLGRAGMSLSNFFRPEGVDNLTKKLGISKLSSPTDYTTGNRGYVTKALCLIGADTFVPTRCNESSRSGATGEIEISIFANIADFIYLTYGFFDNDSNGTLASDEIEGIMDLNDSGISIDGMGTGLATHYYNFEVVAGNNHYIANSDLSSCDTYTDNFTDNSSSGIDCVTKAASDGATISEIRPIFRLDNMTDITAGGTLNTLVLMVSELGMISTALSSDFENIGISSENSFRKFLTSGLSKLDNGAKAKADQTCVAVSLFDVMFLLVKNSADNSTTSSGLKSSNLISTADLKNRVDNSSSLYPEEASEAMQLLPMSSARIIYAKDSSGTNYTDSYEEAESSLYDAMKNTRSLGTEDSIKGDGKVTFRELICIAEN